MRRRGTPVSREALYEEVWTDAVTVVAPRYGLSDVGLVKICKKLGIPVPPRGYWGEAQGRPSHPQGAAARPPRRRARPVRTDTAVRTGGGHARARP